MLLFSLRMGWLLLCLQVLLLLRVLLLHPLSLLLVLLFYLLSLRFRHVPLCQTLVFLFLLLGEFLVLLILFLDQFILLLLIFLIQFGVPSVWLSRAFVRLNLCRVGWGPRNVVLWTSSVLRTSSRRIAPVLRARNIILWTTGRSAATFGCRMVGRSRFPGRHRSGTP